MDQADDGLQALAKEHNEKLRALLGEFIWLMKVHGTRSEEARQFALAHRRVPEFVRLAFATMIFREQLEVREAERRLLGKGPECEECMGEGTVGIFPCKACDGTGDAPT